MSFLFSKLLLFLLNPAFWLFVFLMYFYFANNQKIKKIILRIAIVVFVVFTNSWFFNFCISKYEASYPELKKYEYGLLLGGFSGVNADGKLNFNRSSDRLFQTLLLYKQGYISKIMLSSGNADIFIDRPKEADLVAAYLKKIGIPDTAIVIENQSRNTKENLLNSSKLLSKNQSVLVITSAWHIPRVKLIAQKLALHNFDFYPTNSFRTDHLNIMDCIVPSLSVLDSWSILMKELVGCIVIKIGLQ